MAVKMNARREQYEKSYGKRAHTIPALYFPKREYAMSHTNVVNRPLFLVIKAWGTMMTAFCLALFTAIPAMAEESGASASPAPSMTELNKKLTNPVSDLWSISFQQNNYLLSIPGHGSSNWESNLQFQPVMPVAITSDWNLITRPVIPLFTSVPYTRQTSNPTPHEELARSTAFGDTILMEMVSPSPKVSGNWLLGVGPTFIFPTASNTHNGQGKWQVGPAAIVGYLSHEWIVGAFMQDWVSFAGQQNREAVHQMNLQPFAAYFLPDGWSIGYSGNILANWQAASSNDVWTVPVGLGVYRVVKIGSVPVKIGVAGQYMPIHPKVFGQQWNFQLSVSPVIPKLITGNLFGN